MCRCLPLNLPRKFLRPLKLVAIEACRLSVGKFVVGNFVACRVAVNLARIVAMAIAAV